MTSWTVVGQAPLSMGFSRQEYWSRLPCPPPGDLPGPGMEPRPPTLQVDSLPYKPPGKPKNTGVGSLSLLQEIFVFYFIYLFILLYNTVLVLPYTDMIKPIKHISFPGPD